MIEFLFWVIRYLKALPFGGGLKALSHVLPMNYPAALVAGVGIEPTTLRVIANAFRKTVVHTNRFSGHEPRTHKDDSNEIQARAVALTRSDEEESNLLPEKPAPDFLQGGRIRTSGYAIPKASRYGSHSSGTLSRRASTIPIGRTLGRTG